MEVINNEYEKPYQRFWTKELIKEAHHKYNNRRKEEANKWKKIQFVGKDGNRKEVIPVMPYTLKGFYAFCYEEYGHHVHQVFENKEGRYADCVGICTYVKNFRDSILQIGGLTGHYNANLTARLTDAVEKQEVKVKKLGTDYDAEYVD